MNDALPPDARVLVDCRWLGFGGVGRAMEYLLRGLSDLRPAGKWTLWGGDAVDGFAWPDARVVHNQYPARDLFGQREALSLPPHDVALYLHQSRPLVPGRSVTLIHDTMTLRYRPFARRVVQRAYDWTLAHVSTRVLTVSQYSRDLISRDIGIPKQKIGVVHYPIDREFVARVGALRARLPQRKRLMYVGQFASHKNLDRLVAAYVRSDFARDGEMALVGGAPREVDRLRAIVRELGAKNTTVEGVVSQEYLDELYATSRLLVLPSLEEGFGLPAREALSIGLPVAAANAGALPETTEGLANLFNPYSVDAIAAAIDATAESHIEPLDCADTMADFASVFIRETALALRS